MGTKKVGLLPLSLVCLDDGRCHFALLLSSSGSGVAHGACSISRHRCTGGNGRLNRSAGSELRHDVHARLVCVYD